jgi:hypothetical protein
VAVDRAVLHQAVAEKDPLTVADVLTSEEDAARLVDHPLGDRRVGRISAVGQEPEDEEAEQEDDYRRLKPDLGDDQLALAGYLTAPIATCRVNLTLPPTPIPQEPMALEPSETPRERDF